MSEAVVFDSLGTLFDLEPAREALVRAGAPPHALELWFARTLHHGACVTLAGSFRPFEEVAEGALRLTLAQLGVAQTTAPLESLSRLEPYPDAQQALARLREAGAAVAVLTNGGEDDTRGLLRKGDLEPLVGELVSIDEARAFKPHPSTYALVLRRLGRDPGRVAMVAAHAWDCLGAGAAGMRAVWVDRLEAVWSLPAEEPERARSLVEAVDLLVRGQAGAATTQRRTGS